MAQQVKPLLIAPAGLPAAPVPIELSTNVPENATEGSPRAWASAPTWEIWQNLLASGSGLTQPNCCDHRRVKQQMEEDLSLLPP